MLRAEVSVVGVVNQPVQLKQHSDGSGSYSVSVKTSVPQKEGGVKEIFLYVSAPQSTSAGLERLMVVGQRVSITGTLFFRKDGDNLFVNMGAKACLPVDETVPEGISGDLLMIGVMGSKAPDLRYGKSGKPFMTFSAYSGDGERENRSYTWVRFIRFSGEVESFLLPKALIEAKGTLELQYFNQKLTLSCRLSEVHPYVKQAPSGAPF